MMPDLTAKDVAELMAVHPETVKRLARLGRLPGAYRVGGQWRFAREVIEQMRREVIRSTYHSDADLSGMCSENREGTQNG